MPVYSPMILIRTFFPVLLGLVLLLGGCALPVGGTGGAGYVTAADERGLPRASAFLSLREERSPMVRMTIDEVEILTGQRWYPLNKEPILLDSTRIGGGQILLGGMPLPAGPLQGLRLTISAASSGNTADVWTPLVSVPQVVEIPLSGNIDLGNSDSRSLFLTWDVEASLSRTGGFLPVVSATAAGRPLQLDLVYVSCPEIDTVYVLRSDSNRVVDSFGVSGGVTWLALDPDLSRERLYLLAPRERLIKVVDLQSYRVVDFFPTPLNDVPTFMVLDPQGRALYLLDERSGYVSRMDLASGSITARAALGFRPAYALYLTQQNLLAVSLELSQTVVLLDPLTLQVRKSLPSGSSPRGLGVIDNLLYVAENTDNSVSVFDLGSRARHERISVGYGPRRIFTTETQIYVAHDQEDVVAVLAPGQLGVLREISGAGLIEDMAYRPLMRKLYLADRRGGGIAVIDVNSNRQTNYIHLGARPHGLVTGP